MLFYYATIDKLKEIFTKDEKYKAFGKHNKNTHECTL